MFVYYVAEKYCWEIYQQTSATINGCCKVSAKNTKDGKLPTTRGNLVSLYTDNDLLCIKFIDNFLQIIPNL